MAINTFKRHAKRVIGKSYGENPERRLKYTDPNDPDRKKRYGTTYTDRQLRILSGALSWEDVPMREITFIVNKAQQMNDQDTYEIAKKLQDFKAGKDDYHPKFTAAEAKAILEALDKKAGR